MCKDQRTSGTIEPVTDGQSDLLIQVTKNYPGGKDKLELAKGHSDFKNRVWGLLDVLANERVLQLPIEQRPIWKSLQRTCDDAKAYTADLKAGGFRISDWSADIMKKPGFKKGFDINSVDLVSATGTELTGKSEPTTTEIFDAICKAGGDLLPAWAGPEMRKQYPDQPKGEVLIIAMEPIADSDGSPLVFHVFHDDHGRWLDAYWGSPGRLWYGSHRWVFARLK
ncbi:MAG: hypothetical protein R3B38_01985 [Patescibacteria group bacterium]